MKNIYLLMATLLIFGVGCTNTKDETISQQQQQINSLLNTVKDQASSTEFLQKQIDVSKEKPITSPIKLPITKKPEVVEKTIEKVIEKSIVQKAVEPSILDDVKYREALLSQVDSIIDSEKLFISYIDIIYGFLHTDAPNILDRYSDGLSPQRYNFSESVNALLNQHIVILSSLKENFQKKADALSKVEENEKKILGVYKQMRDDIAADNSINQNEYTEITNKLKDRVAIMLKNRELVEQVFKSVVIDIENQDKSIHDSLEEISKLYSGTPLSQPSFVSPYYSRPTFNVTQCFTSGGGYAPLMINCSGSSF